MPDLLVPAVVFAVSLAVLLAASDVFVSAVERLGLSLGVSPFIVGATVVAGGTSLPELVSSVLAVRAGESAIVVGNVVGSNVANILLVIGVAAVVGGHLRVDRELMRVDLPLLTASAAFLLVAALSGSFSWYDGVVALAALVVYTDFTLSEEARLDEVVEELVEEHADVDVDVSAVGTDALEAAAGETTVGPRTVAATLLALALVFVAADRLVAAILSLATGLGVGTELVAITAVAVGTSLPEAAVSVVAVRRGDVDVAVGNVLGSNVFNTFAVMGVSSFVAPVAVPASVLSYALPAMVVATLLYYFVVQDREITRWEGATLLLLYVTFLANLTRFA
ncbi:MAG: calcium/sodium antiporter [Halobacteriaceae archaeon]